MVAGHGQFNEADKSTVPKEPASQMIHFTRTDGDPNARPTDQQRDRRAVNGEVNFMRPVGVNEPAAALWRKKIGIALAKDLGLDQSKVWYLSGWPVDYELFVHAKGPIAAPRLDMLLAAPSLENTKCDCKYCGNVKFQREINFREGLGPPIAESPGELSFAPVASGSGTKTRPKRAPAGNASSPHRRVDDERFQPVNTYLESDLRTNRNFRLGEVVWVHLTPSIDSFSPTGRKIEWWPALIQEPRIKTEVAARMPGQPSGVRQFQVYRVLMLGTTSQYVIQDDWILPYQAYALPSTFLHEITQTIRSTTSHQQQYLDFDRALNFAPLPLPLRTSSVATKEQVVLPVTYPDALVPYLAAIHIARLVSTYWCATDNYEFVSVPTQDVPEPMKQTRFQGLWWGGERLWVGDLVRIKPARNHLTGNLLEPSLGAEKRGLLLRLEAIYLDGLKQEPEGEGQVAETEWKPMVFGTLYEVAQADFVEPPVTESSSLGNVVEGFNTPLPAPPPGFKFRAITPSAKFDVHFELCMVAGRYYPNILSSPLLPLVAPITTLTPFSSQLPSTSNSRTTLVPNYPPSLLSLAALAIGAVNPVNAVNWKEGRTQMLTCARQEMVSLFQPQNASYPTSRDLGTPAPPPSAMMTASPMGEKGLGPVGSTSRGGVAEDSAMHGSSPVKPLSSS
ncbi:hypothetical protein FRB90_004143 [Tulasnella sp. 427]|nr:hypothetical protein FRB90_004143 [Tulasnella sp. 427]